MDVLIEIKKDLTGKVIGRLRPRDSIFYFSKHKEKWGKLKNGEVVKVPMEVAEICNGIVIKDTVEIKPKKKRKTKKGARKYWVRK